MYSKIVQVKSVDFYHFTYSPKNSFFSLFISLDTKDVSSIGSFFFELGEDYEKKVTK